MGEIDRVLRSGVAVVVTLYRIVMSLAGTADTGQPTCSHGTGGGAVTAIWTR